jgi:hypothetical protein
MQLPGEIFEGKQYVFGIQGFEDSRFQFEVSKYQGLKFSRNLDFRFLRFLGVRVSRFQGFEFSRF